MASIFEYCSCSVQVGLQCLRDVLFSFSFIRRLSNSVRVWDVPHALYISMAAFDRKGIGVLFEAASLSNVMLMVTFCSVSVISIVVCVGASTEKKALLVLDI